MKIKCQPDDFIVEELPTVRPDDRGRFGYYRLTKEGLGTPEAIEVIRRRWNLAAESVRYGGLKDRHAKTIQYLTILNGPERELREASFHLEPLGRLAFPYGPAWFRGNRFVVVLRDLDADELERAKQAASKVEREGLPNYFDDQRFGSVAPGGGFIAEAWLRGDHELALRRAIVEPNPSDRPAAREEKLILAETWGRWPEAKQRLPRSHARSLVTYLCDHPTDFRGAFARLRRDLRSIYFSAYQSHLWNLMLARRIEQITRPEQRVVVKFRAAPLPIPRDLDEEQIAALRSIDLPLPASRTRLPDDGPIRELAEEVVRGQGLEWDDLKVKHLKDVFFSKGARAALYFPGKLRTEAAADELYPGRSKLTLSFELPRGAYATLLVKRLTEVA